MTHSNQYSCLLGSHADQCKTPLAFYLSSFFKVIADKLSLVSTHRFVSNFITLFNRIFEEIFDAILLLYATSYCNSIVDIISCWKVDASGCHSY